MTPILTPPPETLACVRVADLAVRTPEQLWLIEGLWFEGGVGVLGGPPKNCKSWLGFDMAVSVASGTPCLGRHRIARPGPVMVFASEDPPPMVRQRIEGLAKLRGLELASLPVDVITEPVLHLDRPQERQRLQNTVAKLRPRLLILDPLVRIYGNVDENSAAEVSGFLGHLRALSRQFDVAVLLVHHAKKGAAGVGQPGAALRGSGDLHAWVDSLLYLRRVGAQKLQMAIEHRSAASPEPVELRFVADTAAPAHLEYADNANGNSGHVDKPALAELVPRLLSLLTRASRPQTTDELRKSLGVRKARLIAELEELRQHGHVTRGPQGWGLPLPTGQLALPGVSPASSTATV